MAKRILKFPDNFRWGVASASHQNEGNNHNNDFWQWERIPGHIVDGSTSGLACDWWNRAEEDFARAAEMGINSLRLSLEWSRLEPQPGVWDTAAFDRYRAMLDALHQLDIEPMLTLHHFSNPIWLAQIGGWANNRVVAHFEKYADKVVAAMGERCRLWCTINEPTIYGVFSHLFGKWFPGSKSILKFMRVSRNQVAAHAAAYHAIHKQQPQAQVGPAKHMAGFVAGNPESIGARWSARLHDTIFNWRFIEAVSSGKLFYPITLFPHNYAPARNSCDYLGLNYYGRHLLQFSPARPQTLFARPLPADAKIAWPQPWTDREIYPAGIYEFIKRMSKVKNEIYITENGMADSDDSIRPAFLLTHLAALHRAITEGVNVRGYYHWTLVDNYEWVEGWTTRFGLIALDPQSQQRTRRRSAQLYSAICRENAISEESVQQYAPEVFDQIFAGQ